MVFFVLYKVTTRDCVPFHARRRLITRLYKGERRVDTVGVPKPIKNLRVFIAQTVINQFVELRRITQVDPVLN